MTYPNWQKISETVGRTVIKWLEIGSLGEGGRFTQIRGSYGHGVKSRSSSYAEPSTSESYQAKNLYRRGVLWATDNKPK